MRVRKPLLIAASAAVLAAGAYTGYWFYARGAVLDAVAQWVAARREAGYRIAHDPPRSGGFPFAVRIEADAVSIAPADESWRWRAARLGVEIRPWNFRRIRLEAFGPQRFTVRRDGAQYDMAVDSRESAAVVALAATGRVTGATLRIQDSRITGDAGDIQLAELWLEATQAATRPATHAETSFTLSLAARKAVLPVRFATGLGRKIETLRAKFRVLGAIPRGPLRDAAEAWREDGGTIEVEWLHLTWGAVDVRAKGTLALDAEHRPLGALTADIRGHGAALDALREASVVSAKTAALAKIGLALLARAPPGGGAPVLTVPVTAQAGKLYLGPIKILTLPRIPLSVQPR